MKTRSFLKLVGAGLMATLWAAATSAMAADSSQAWGTAGGGGPGGRAQASAQLHRTESENAQAVEIGREIISMYRSVTSCGVCVYNQITGNKNSINGNSISGENSGTVSAEGTFGDSWDSRRRSYNTDQSGQ